jgi:hypothetical protein
VNLVQSGRYWVALGSGRPADALAAVSALKDHDRYTNLELAWRAIALGKMGRTDEAYAELEKALAAGYADSAELRGSTFWAPLRGSPRWNATLARHGLTP